MIGLRAAPEMREAIEAWAARQPDNPSLSEAIRRLVELGLTVEPREKPARKTGSRSGRASEASELAGQAIDRLVDKSAPFEERERRKRRLIKGPPEFRDVRGDLPKPKS
jgi:hypothetical protein